MEKNLVLDPDRRQDSFPETVEVADRYVFTALPADKHHIVAINNLSERKEGGRDRENH